MPTPMGARRLIQETVPVAVILLFWGLLSAFPHAMIATGLRYAGAVMALFYVVVRGTQLAGPITPASGPDDIAGLLRENGYVAVCAGSWFLAAFLVSATRPIWSSLSIVGTPFPRAIDALSSLFSVP